MGWLNYRTEYSFGAVYGHLDKVVDRAAELGTFAGIADFYGTWGHVKWAKACKKKNIKPIFGIVLPVTEKAEPGKRRYSFDTMTFIARNSYGLEEIHELVDQAYQQHYYRPLLTYKQLNNTTNNIFVITGLSPDTKQITRETFWKTSPDNSFQDKKGIEIACIDNFYINPEDSAIYEPFAEKQKLERKTTPQYILTHEEWLTWCNSSLALENLLLMAQQIEPIDLPQAPMITYPEKHDILTTCEKGAKAKKINLKDPIYKERFVKEIQLIKDKEYVDYFFVVADVIKYAKKRMTVGPARGSSAGSLVCYLMGITEIDPIPYGLFFERFIDVNRYDLPDIDVDFQDNKRHLVINYLKRKYGNSNVAQIGNINKLKAKSAITRFAKALNIPIGDVEEIKDAILERSGGDARAAMCMADTFDETDAGKRFLEKHPNMDAVKYIEAHASHTGVHAAGILVCNQAITKYTGINSRENNTRIAMIDKKDAEALNLLKIDALGLRTLTIFADVCDQIKKPYGWLYQIPLDDKKAYQVFNDQRLTGIFQFEGESMRSLSVQMPVENMEDISALVAISRPGPLASGGATKYLKCRTGHEPIKYLSEHPTIISATKDTYGIVIYQEQVLAIGREYGGLSWADTSELRKALSKSLGKEFFDKYKKRFMEGALEKGEQEEEAEKVWENINTFGCLAGDTVIDLPCSNQYSPSKITIEQLFFNDGQAQPAETKDNRNLQKKRGNSKIWMYDFEKECCKPTRPIKVVQSGSKKVYKIRTEKNTIKATKLHKFLTPEGWKKAQELSEGDAICVMGKPITKQKINRSMALAEVVSIEYVGIQMTYDITMPAPDHNFVAEGFIVHNSWGMNKCVHEKTKIKLAHPNQFLGADPTIKNLYDYYIGSPSRWIKQKNRKPVLLCFDGEKAVPVEARTIHKTGSKKCVKMVFDNGEIILCTQDHKFIIDGEWKPCSNAKIGSVFCRAARKRKAPPLVLIECIDIGYYQTYDIEMPPPFHNYILSNGIVTHNSHTISYSLISYQCAYLKAHYPLEFAVACLNHAKDQPTALKLLRDLHEYDGIEYVDLDKEKSVENWAAIDGKLYGGLTTVDGIGPSNAKKIIKLREEKKPLPPGLGKRLNAKETPFTFLYPGREKYGHYYVNPKEFGVNGRITHISDVDGRGAYTIVACMTKKNLRDANELVNVGKRGGEYVTGPTAFLSLHFEDDTGTIIATIDRHDYERLGRNIAETGKENKDWYLVHGLVPGHWKFLIIKNIRRITL